MSASRCITRESSPISQSVVALPHPPATKWHWHFSKKRPFCCDIARISSNIDGSGQVCQASNESRGLAARVRVGRSAGPCSSSNEQGCGVKVLPRLLWLSPWHHYSKH